MRAERVDQRAYPPFVVRGESNVVAGKARERIVKHNRAARGQVIEHRRRVACGQTQTALEVLARHPLAQRIAPMELTQLVFGRLARARVRDTRGKSVAQSRDAVMGLELRHDRPDLLDSKAGPLRDSGQVTSKVPVECLQNQLVGRTTLQDFELFDNPAFGASVPARVGFDDLSAPDGLIRTTDDESISLGDRDWRRQL